MTDVDMTEVQQEMNRLVGRSRRELANETVRTLMNRRISFWPIRTGLSIRGWRVSSVDDRGFTVENPVDYAIYVEAKHTRPRLPALTTIRQNLVAIVRRVNARSTN